jgi:hypothetical protein
VNKKVSSFVLLGVVTFLVLIFLHLYWVYAPQYAMNLFRENTPCVPANIVHDTTFTALPFMSWSREHDCLWTTFISSPLPPAYAHSAGYDALNQDNILWNESFPKGRFYYVQALINGYGDRTPPGNASVYWTDEKYVKIWAVNNI